MKCRSVSDICTVLLVTSSVDIRSVVHNIIYKCKCYKYNIYIDQIQVPNRHSKSEIHQNTSLKNL